MEYLELPPSAPILIESTRSIGYTLEAAIADIIDNSISAESNKIEIEYFPKSCPYIAILDDGRGMPKEKLTEAMRYGSSDPNLFREKNDMGRFGLGMKMSSLSQCRCLTVISKQNSEIFARQWDLDYIKQVEKWSLKCLDNNEINDFPLIDKLKKQTSGTLVLWYELDKVFIDGIDDSVMTSKMLTVSDHLSLVFHRFLKGGDAENKVNIYMNGVEIKGSDPFFQTKSRFTMAEERIEIPEYNSVVIVQPYTLPHHLKLSQQDINKYGLRNMQGFYIYRNKRLLKWGTWFRLARFDELSKLARVRIDIPNTLDELWTLDVKKSSAMPPEIVKIRLKQIINKIVDSSKRVYTFRGRKEKQDGIVHIWNILETREGLKYKINQNHPLYEKLLEMIDNDAKKVFHEYVYNIAEHFPVGQIQIDFSQEKKIIKDNIEDEFENIKNNILQILLKIANTKEEREKIVEKLITSEPFCNYKDQMLNFMGEYHNEET